MSIDQQAERLRQSITDFVVPLQTTRVVKKSAFESLHASAKQIARELKGSTHVPRALLNELYGTMQILRAEAPYLRGETANIEAMANQIEMIFGLILQGEAPEDRRPGVPRVI